MFNFDFDTANLSYHATDSVQFAPSVEIFNLQKKFQKGNGQNEMAPHTVGGVLAVCGAQLHESGRPAEQE